MPRCATSPLIAGRSGCPPPQVTRVRFATAARRTLRSCAVAIISARTGSWFWLETRSAPSRSSSAPAGSVSDGLLGDPVLQRVAEDGGCPLGIGIVQSLVGRDAETVLVELVKVPVPVPGPDGDEGEGGDGTVMAFVVEKRCLHCPDGSKGNTAPFEDHRVAPVDCRHHAGTGWRDRVDILPGDPALLCELPDKVFRDMLRDPAGAPCPLTPRRTSSIPHLPDPAHHVRAHLDDQRVGKLALHLRDMGDQEDLREA